MSSLPLAHPALARERIEGFLGLICAYGLTRCACSLERFAVGSRWE
jgi:hypothetical protein